MSQGVNIRGVNVLEGKFPEGIYPWGKCLGGYMSCGVMA